MIRRKFRVSPSLLASRAVRAFALPALGALVSVATTGCLQGPQFMQSRGNASALESKFVVDTTENAGDVTGMIQAAMNRYQTLNAAAGSDVDGASVVFPPGALSVDADVIVGAGSDAASADVLAQVGLDSTVASGVGSSLYVSTTAKTDPVLPMTLSLPLPASSGLVGYAKALFLDQDTTRYAISFVAERKATGETFVGFIPNREITFVDGKAQFATSNWGSYRLIQLAPEAEKPVERVLRNTVADVAPRRQNEVKDNPKMLVTGRAPFVVRQGGSVVLSGENLKGVRAFIKDRRLTTAETDDGKSLTITMPTAAELSATTGNTSGMFFIGLGQDGSPGVPTNVYIPATGTTLTEAVLSPDPNRVCARQEFLDGTGTTRVGSGTSNCAGRPVADSQCAAGTLANCVASTAWPAVEVARVKEETLKSGTVLALASGSITGAFPSSTYKLGIPPGGRAADISAHPDFSKVPVFGASVTDTQAITLITESGAGVTFNLRRAGPQTSSTSLPMLTAGAQLIDRSATNTLYNGFVVAGTGLDPAVGSPMIVAGKSIFGAAGTMPPRNFWSKSGTIWNDSATGYSWSIVNSTPTLTPATCTQGAVPTKSDLDWAIVTGMTSGPGALITTLPAKIWAQGTNTSGTTISMVFRLASGTGDATASTPSTGETAITACVDKPANAAGNGP